MQQNSILIKLGDFKNDQLVFSLGNLSTRNCSVTGSR